MLKRFLIAILAVLAMSCAAVAQEMDVDKYNITAKIDFGTSAVDVQSQIQLVNPASTSKPKIFLRLTKQAKLGQVTIGGAPVQADTSEDHRFPALNMITVTPSSSIPPGGRVTVGVSYRLEVPDSTALLSIYPGEVLLLPEAVWFPAPSTAFAIYGANTAPFTLSASAAPSGAGFRVVSAGAVRGEGQAFTYEESANSLPFIVAGNYEVPVQSDHGGIKVSVYMQPGLGGLSASGPEAGSRASSDEAQSGGGSQAGGGSKAARITAEAGRVVDFLTKMLGPPPAGSTFTVISSVRAGNFAVPGALVLNEGVFRQDTLDATTVELLADALARIWIDGRVRIRGQDARSAQVDQPAQRARSAALLRDSMPRYLAARYLESRYGADAGREVFNRMRAVYTPVAQSRRDSELSVQTLVLATYADAALAKGPLVLRLMAHTLGPDKLIEALKRALDGPQTKIVTLTDYKDALGNDPAVDHLFAQWIDSIVLPDLIIGIPQPSDKPGVQRVNLRNLGTGECPVTVVATTASGKQMTLGVTVPSQDLTYVDIPTAEKINSVAVDPDKYIIQTNYDNDSKPVRVSAPTLLNDGIVAFNKGEFQKAESSLRQAVQEAPRNALLHAWLARALAAQNKFDEAAAEAKSASTMEPPLVSAVAWSHITLGQVALAKGQGADAVANLRRALSEAVEAPAQTAAREYLVKAQTAAGTPPQVDESVRAFITQLDGLLRQPSSDKLFEVVIKNNLKRFVEGLTVSPPQSWSTEVLSVDRIDANRVELYVALKVKSGGRDQAGTAVYTLYRTGSGWKLENIKLFEVK
jgi:tetratricopeptide (TPR) repeat protein